MTQRRNLSQAKILQATRDLAKEIGMSQITFPKLAASLNIKYPSLYNHFKNMGEVKFVLTKELIDQLKERLLSGLVGKSGPDALRTYCQLYHDFAFENASVYELLINIPHSHSEVLIEKNMELNRILQKIMAYYPLDEVSILNKSRMLRSMLHGYISMRFLGYFQNNLSPADDSYHVMVEEFISLLEELPKK